MDTISIVVTVVCTIAGLATGILFGAVPLKASRMTETQNKWQQYLGVGFVVVVFLLMYVKQDAASWAIIIAAIVGLVIAKIPPIHTSLLAHFPSLRPKEEEDEKRSKKSKKNKKNKK
ncbi:hypothetical protein [Bifidobacterium sp. ESL0790]|uniref:hypothetical protein n=1 Tax=Bifidobacterium sp. ESL0790 TaxID=2983233 RepID=UPI0023F68FD3|nr:hypothetical protein [Bifidobacterium sp. ESL0790]WEV73137.1 hypothetical protein OZY47_04115 [Bifidobacterium sp. ESL0790]